VKDLALRHARRRSDLETLAVELDLNLPPRWDAGGQGDLHHLHPGGGLRSGRLLGRLLLLRRRLRLRCRRHHLLRRRGGDAAGELPVRLLGVVVNVVSPAVGCHGGGPSRRQACSHRTPAQASGRAAGARTRHRRSRAGTPAQPPCRQQAPSCDKRSSVRRKQAAAEGKSNRSGSHIKFGLEPAAAERRLHTRRQQPAHRSSISHARSRYE
jgi:hypothetical protein